MGPNFKFEEDEGSENCAWFAKKKRANITHRGRKLMPVTYFSLAMRAKFLKFGSRDISPWRGSLNLRPITQTTSLFGYVRQILNFEPKSLGNLKNRINSMFTAIKNNDLKKFVSYFTMIPYPFVFRAYDGFDYHILDPKTKIPLQEAVFLL